MENSYLWTERYSTKKFEEVIGHHDIVKRLKALVEQKIYLTYYSVVSGSWENNISISNRKRTIRR